MFNSDDSDPVEVVREALKDNQSALEAFQLILDTWNLDDEDWTESNPWM